MTTNHQTRQPARSIAFLLAAALVFALSGCIEGQPAPEGTGDELILECGHEALHSYDHDGCEPMDAEGAGEPAYCFLGFIWDGEACVELSGWSECAGIDCDSLAPTEEACLAAHEGC